MRLGAFAVGVALWGVGCASGDASRGAGGGVEVLLDRGEPPARRVRAAQALGLDAGTREKELAGLHVVAWSDRHPVRVRTAAIDRLRADDAEAFWRAAERWLVSVDHEAVLAALAERAAEDGRVELIPVLVRRWAKPRAGVADPERTEYRAVSALAEGEAPVVTLERVLAGNDRRAAAAAWTVLMRWKGEPEMRRRMHEWPTAPGALRADLRAAAEVLGRLPLNDEGLAWLSAWRARPDRWARWAEVFAALPPEARTGIELRHLPIVMRSHGGRWESAVALREQIAAAQVGAQTYTRQAEPDGPGERGLETWVWADLLVVRAVHEAMHRPAVRRAWFEQADRDHRDATTEYGGVLTWDDHGRFTARGFAPQRKEGDRKFFTPPALVAAMYTGLAHYHFHAQSHNHAAYAGPGRGDLAFTEALRANTLVLTFVDRDTLNLDLALPGGVVLDLGSVVRPQSGADAR